MNWVVGFVQYFLEVSFHIFYVSYHIATGSSSMLPLHTLLIYAAFDCEDQCYFLHLLGKSAHFL